MNLSEDRKKSLTYSLIKELSQTKMVSFQNEQEARRWALKGASAFMVVCRDIEKSVEAKIKSLKRNVIENSQEWNILYSKYYEEELVRRGQ